MFLLLPRFTSNVAAGVEKCHQTVGQIDFLESSRHLRTRWEQLAIMLLCENFLFAFFYEQHSFPVVIGDDCQNLAEFR